MYRLLIFVYDHVQIGRFDLTDVQSYGKFSLDFEFLLL